MPIDLSKITSVLTGGGSIKADTSRLQEAANEKIANPTPPYHGNFTKGQVFSGQITNISPNEITIELENGETMSAKYENSADLSIGDGARFKVVSNVDRTLVIKALTPPNGGMETAILKALDASGLPFSEKNEELITALLKNELPVNKQMINKILHQSLKNMDVSISNLVVMNKANLPISQEITSMFEAYSRGENSFFTKIHDSFYDLLSIVEGLIEEKNPKEASRVIQHLLKSLDLGLDADERVESNLSSLSDKAHELPENLDDFNTLLKNSIAKEAKQDIPSPLLGEEAEKSHIFSPETKLSTIFSEIDLMEIFSAFETSDVEASSIQKLIEGELTLKDLSELIDQLTTEERQNPLLLPSVLKGYSTLFNKESDSSFLRDLLPPDLSLSESTALLKTILASDALNPSQTLAFLRSPEPRKILERLFLTDLTLSPEELRKEGSINTFYHRVSALLSKFSSAFEMVGGDKSEGMSQTSSAKEQLQFLNTISQYFNYSELPLRLTGQTVAGDLYVYSDKKKGKPAKTDSISCLLHLNPVNLGAVNIRIELKEYAVTTKFYLEDNESGNLISRNLTELDKAIQKQGFLPVSEVIKSPKNEKSEFESGKYSLVKDFIPSELSKNHFTRYTFDVRA